VTATTIRIHAVLRVPSAIRGTVSRIRSIRGRPPVLANGRSRSVRRRALSNRRVDAAKSRILRRHRRAQHVVLPLAGAILLSAATFAYLQSVPTTYGAVAAVAVNETQRPADSHRALLLLRSSGASRSVEFPFLPNADFASRVLAARTAKAIPGMTPAMVADSVHVTDTARRHEFEAFQEPVRTLEINARASSPLGAATLANTYAHEYVAYRREFFTRRMKAIRARPAFRAVLGRRVRTMSPRPSPLQRWIREVGVVAEVEARRLRLYRRATAAERSRSPRRLRDVTVAALIGAFAGALLASLVPIAEVRRRQST
jgi:hypothetical protein